MPLPFAAYGAYVAGSAALGLAFRAAASPMGVRATNFVYENVTGIGNGLATIYNKTAQGLGIAGALLAGSSIAAAAKEDPAPAAIKPVPAGPQVPIAF